MYKSIYLLFLCMLSRSLFSIREDHFQIFDQAKHNIEISQRLRACQRAQIKAHIQALRNQTIVEQDDILAQQDYQQLELNVLAKSKALNIPHHQMVYIIVTQGERLGDYVHTQPKEIELDIIHSYGKYLPSEDKLPRSIKNHKCYVSYNRDHKLPQLTPASNPIRHTHKKSKQSIAQAHRSDNHSYLLPSISIKSGLLSYIQSIRK